MKFSDDTVTLRCSMNFLMDARTCRNSVDRKELWMSPSSSEDMLMEVRFDRKRKGVKGEREKVRSGRVDEGRLKVQQGDDLYTLRYRGMYLRPFKCLKLERGLKFRKIYV